MLLAKPYGNLPIELTAHLNRVAEEAASIIDAYKFVSRKYDKWVGKSLKKQTARAAKYHDWGKAHKKWQSACKADREYHQETGGYANNLRTAEFRHEFDSLRKAEKHNLNLSEAEKVAIAAHHGKLSYAHEHRWMNDNNGKFRKMWDFFHGLDNGKYAKASTNKLLQKRYEMAGVRSFLRFADSRVSARENGVFKPPIKHSFKIDENKYASLRPVQEAALNHVDEEAIILRAPTGSGKTWAALLWANQQINVRGNADRLIIAMPTRFTSNSLSIDVARNIDNTGLYHSSAWFKYDNLKKGKDKKAREALDEELRMARYLMTPATITTIDHLLMCLTGTREEHHHAFFSLMHSCVVIDEADFYDTFVQANIIKLLEVLRVFDIRVMIMSATVPESARELYDIDKLIDPYNEKKPVNKIAKKEATRVRCTIGQHGKVEPHEALDEIIVDDMPDPIIIFANTVRRSLEYFDWFKQKNVEPVIYHSRFTEPDKKRLEDKIIDKIGQNAWDNGQAKGVFILTQIGEMSLNISAPLMISDVCPFDRLAQRAGRLSRFEGMDSGKLHTVIPVKDGKVYPAPYGEFDRKEKEWIAYDGFTKTLNRLSDRQYSAADFANEVNMLYPNPDHIEGAAKRNQRMLEEHLKHNWLILPDFESEDRDFETGKWRSRNIPQQQTVLTRMPDKYMDYQEFEKLKLEHGISSPMYQISMGKSLNRVWEEKVFIGNEEKEEVVLVSNAYSKTVGLILDEDREKPTVDQIIWDTNN